MPGDRLIGEEGTDADDRLGGLSGSGGIGRYRVVRSGIGRTYGVDGQRLSFFSREQLAIAVPANGWLEAAFDGNAESERFAWFDNLLL